MEDTDRYFDIEYLKDDKYQQETGLLYADAWERKKELKEEGADEIRILQR